MIRAAPWRTSAIREQVHVVDEPDARAIFLDADLVGSARFMRLPFIARRNAIRARLAASACIVVQCEALARFGARRSAWCVRRGGRNLGYK
jgi:hypothetical protein